MTTGVIFLVLRVLLVVALYAFLGWALFTIWRDIKRRGEDMATREVPSVVLRVSEDGMVQTIQLAGTEISIGRDPICDCTLRSEKVSANHALLSYHHNQWWVEDLDSTNGTYLNGEIVTASVVVADGDSLRCGDVVMTVNFQME